MPGTATRAAVAEAHFLTCTSNMECASSIYDFGIHLIVGVCVSTVIEVAEQRKRVPAGTCAAAINATVCITPIDHTSIGWNSWILIGGRHGVVKILFVTSDR